MVERVCMARFASRGLSLTVSLLEVSWGQYQTLFSLQQLRQELSQKAETSVLFVNIQPLFTIWIETENFNFFKVSFYSGLSPDCSHMQIYL